MARLEQEVFDLAYYLHWSHDAIVSLPILERRHYLKLLQEQLQRENPSDSESFS